MPGTDAGGIREHDKSAPTEVIGEAGRSSTGLGLTGLLLGRKSKYCVLSYVEIEVEG